MAEDRTPLVRWRDACLLCGSARLVGLSAFQRAYLVRCRECSMIFAARIPSAGELARHYDDYGHGWHDSPITRHRYQELLDTFEPYRSTNRILDFGCGAGFFLEEARARGWQAYGTEYSGWALELARKKNLNVAAAPVQPGTFEPGSFDVVTAFEVFEHVTEPNAEARFVTEVLRPGGLLYCTTPNFNALSRRLLGARWNIVEYPEHLCYFTPATIRSWLRRFGFEPEAVISSGFSLARLRSSSAPDAGMGQPGVERGDSAGGDEALRETIERSRVLRLGKTLANHSLSAFGAGDTLKGYFRLTRDGSASGLSGKRAAPTFPEPSN